MSPKAQRIAIAQACGFFQMPHPLPPYPPVFSKDGMKGAWLHEGNLPDYLNDLNAMHEAEEALASHFLLLPRYTDFVRTMVERDNRPGRIWVGYATAAQRAEAFLRTINLWDDTK